ncbi:MAG: twin-arginine translocation pathway signal, partial [Alphaproteobacteria bacterium PA3]
MAPGPLAAQQRAGGAVAAGYDFWFTRLKYNSGDWNVDQRMPAIRFTALSEFTSLRVYPKEHRVDLGDPKMLSAPFCYLAG